MMLKIIIFFSFLIFISCKSKNIVLEEIKQEDTKFLSAVDISDYPQIKTSNPIFYDNNGVQKDFIELLKNNGVNTIRLRLWVNPINQNSGFNEVKQFSEELKNKGFKIWLSVHYSDTWADPSQQILPNAWQNISYERLKDSVYYYTKNIIQQIKPNYIQIGNEINGGFLHPYGNINNINQFKELLQKGISAVRENSTNTKIMLHFAGIDSANWFFENVPNLDYDMIGLSYYPIWHGKSLTNLKNTMTNLSSTYQKEVVIAETAYPFTLNWNDWTNNIVGLESQLILPDFPATEIGQKNFIKNIVQLCKEIPNNKGIGFCYWGAELIAWKGNQATNGSPWENQSLFNFQNKALPVLEEFKVK